MAPATRSMDAYIDTPAEYLPIIYPPVTLKEAKKQRGRPRPMNQAWYDYHDRRIAADRVRQEVTTKAKRTREAVQRREQERRARVAGTKARVLEGTGDPEQNRLQDWLRPKETPTTVHDVPSSDPWEAVPIVDLTGRTPASKTILDELERSNPTVAACSAPVGQDQAVEAETWSSSYLAGILSSSPLRRAPSRTPSAIASPPRTTSVVDKRTFSSDIGDDDLLALGDELGQ